MQWSTSLKRTPIDGVVDFPVEEECLPVFRCPHLLNDKASSHEQCL